MENGRDPAPTPERLTAIAQALELAPDTLVDLARQTGPALTEYLDQVPPASAFFLEIARRRLDGSQIARLRELMDSEFPPAQSQDHSAPLSKLIDRRIILGLSCTTIHEVIDTAIELFVGADKAEQVSRQIIEREQASSTAIGNGVAVPHALIPGMQRVAALITLATPLQLLGPDGIPIELAIVMVGPDGDRPHLELLAQVARLASQDVAVQLRSIHRPRQARALIERLETQ